MKRPLPRPFLLAPLAASLATLLAASSAASSIGAVAGAVQQEEPPEERGLSSRGEGAFPGYTLISPLLSHDVFLLDLDGNVVHTWKTEHAPAGSVYLLDDGRLLRGARVEENERFRGGGIGGRLQVFDWDGRLLWDYLLADDYLTAHHDVEPMPNGNVLAIVWEHRFREDALEWGRDDDAVGEEGIWPDAVLELRPIPPDDAEVVWEWHAWDHTVQDRDPDKLNYGDVAKEPGRIDINVEHRDRPAFSAEELARREELERQMQALGYVGGEEEEVDDASADAPGGAGDGGGRRSTAPDWMHTNGVDYDPVHDLIVLSSPNLSEIFVIDHSTTTDEAAFGDGGRRGHGGDLLWRWGNPRNHGAGEDADRRLFYQHDPEWIPGHPDELRLLVFNNGSGRPGDYSTVEELVLPFDEQHGFRHEPGRPFGPDRPAWTYGGPGGYYSGFISGAQRLPNGNTLVCFGAEGRLVEVTPSKDVVWEFLNPHGGEAGSTSVGGNAPPKALFRATRLALDHPGLAGRL